MALDPRQFLADQRAAIDLSLRWAAGQVARLDDYLLRSDLKEEAVNHRLAVYLEQAIQSHDAFRGFGFSVDAEYDKFGMEPKSVTNTYDPADMPDRKRDRRLRPDIIVHQRGNHLGRINLLAVEVKKSSTVSKRATKYALWKCEAYRVSNLYYLYSACICLKSGDDWAGADDHLEYFHLFQAVS